MGHREAAARAIGPKPYERDSVHSFGFHGKQKNQIEEVFNGCVYRPVREGPLPPIARMELLNLLPHALVCKPPQEIIEFPAQPPKATLHCEIAGIAFETKIVEHFVQVKWQTNFSIVNFDRADDITQRRLHRGYRNSKRRAPVTDGVGAEAKISGFRGQFSLNADI